MASVPLMIEYEAVLSREEHLLAAGLSAEEMQPSSMPSRWSQTPCGLHQAKGMFEVVILSPADALKWLRKRP